MIIRSDFSVQSLVELAEHKISVALVFHQLLESVQLQPTHTFTKQNLANDLL
jgi:hypothetical protein